MNPIPPDVKSTEPSSREQAGRAALVADLLTAQSNHISSLKWAVGILEGKISLRNSLAEVQAEALRTPFRDVMSILGKLRDEVAATDSEHLKKLGREVEESMDQVRRAVQSIGDWLTASTDPTILYPREALQRVEMEEVMDRVFAEMGSTFDRTRLTITGLESITVTTAPARLAAIVTALLENAVRHGGPGPIEMNFSVSVQQDLKIVISDHGLGLKGNDPELLFRPRPQLPSETQEWAPLLGLGLFLTRMMAESLGGSVTLSDREGGGMEVIVILPQRRRRDVQVT